MIWRADSIKDSAAQGTPACRWTAVSQRSSAGSGTAVKAESSRSSATRSPSSVTIVNAAGEKGIGATIEWIIGQPAENFDLAGQSWDPVLSSGAAIGH